MAITKAKFLFLVWKIGFIFYWFFLGSIPHKGEVSSVPLSIIGLAAAVLIVHAVMNNVTTGAIALSTGSGVLFWRIYELLGVFEPPELVTASGVFASWVSFVVLLTVDVIYSTVRQSISDS